MAQKWRWLAWSGSFLLLLMIGFSWGQLGRIQEAGSFRAGCHALLWVGMMGMVFALPALDKKKTLILLGVAAVLVRLSFWQAPVSDDVNRYLWEGSLLWKGENPYATVVDDERWIPHRDQYWADVNHRDRLTAYPPGMELIMAGASWLWYDLQVFKIVALLGDFWVLGILALLFLENRKPLRWLSFYAFNPIVLASFAAEAHFDSLMVGAMLTALFCAQRKRWGWVWFWFGVAVQMKFIVMILFPYFLVRGDWRKSWIFALVLILPSLIFGEHLLQGLIGLLGFGKDGAFNGGAYESLRIMGFSDSFSRGSTTLLFVAVGLLFGWRTLKGQEKDWLSLTFILIGALLICSPVVHFWYLTWILPLVALRPSVSWLLLCLTTSAYFFAWEGLEHRDSWGYHRGWVVATWLPFFGLVLWEFRDAWRRRMREDFSEAKTVDLVVPIYQAAKTLESFLKKLREVSPEVGRIIVVDGGSSDGSPEIARRNGCEVLSCQLGRGAQISAGLKASSADLVAIIHADTVPRQDWMPYLMEVAHLRPRSAAFALGQRFSRESPGLLLVEVLNEARAIFRGSVFGDQTLIVRREALARMGGFPDQPLMEDVEASWRLMEQGHLTYLGQEWGVSAQKWKGRFRSRFQQVVGLMIRYRWVRRRGRNEAAEFSRELYREYYPNRGE